jgi:hypothetical protein
MPGMKRLLKRLLSRWLVPELTDEIKRLDKKISWLRAQLMQLRVAQAEYPRRGWEVMAYIPEEVLDKLNTADPEAVKDFIRSVATPLVTYAISGIVRVRSNGQCTALVFEPLSLNSPPRAAGYMQAVFDKGGKYKISNPLPRLPEKERLMKASGW